MTSPDSDDGMEDADPTSSMNETDRLIARLRSEALRAEAMGFDATAEAILAIIERMAAREKGQDR